jgi:monoamine oxidase
MPFLTGWVGGPRAASVVGLSQHDLVDRALGSLSSIFGQQTRTLRNGLQAVHAHDWSTDPYSRGAYSYGGVGARAAREVLRQPRADTLFLSGEALATEGRNATVAGALSSGLRAAAALLGKAV